MANEGMFSLSELNSKMIRPNNASRLMYFIFIARIGLFVLMKKATYLFSTVFFSLIFQEENCEILL